MARSGIEWDCCLSSTMVAAKLGQLCADKTRPTKRCLQHGLTRKVTLRYVSSNHSIGSQSLDHPRSLGSGNEHWQSRWEEQHPEFIRVNQRDWNTPVCHDWLSTLDAAIRKENDNVILVGHSLGSVTIVHWASHYRRRIVGALMVAPSDTEAATFPKGTTGFAPIPTIQLPFPSTVIASTEDPLFPSIASRDCRALGEAS
jgi:predicted alpha/beta hydrolase family esterase